MSHPVGAAPRLDQEPGVHLPSLPSGDRVYPVRLTASRRAPLHRSPGSPAHVDPRRSWEGGKKPLQSRERRLHSPRSCRTRGMRCWNDGPTPQHPNGGYCPQPRGPINPLLARGLACSTPSHLPKGWRFPSRHPNPGWALCMGGDQTALSPAGTKRSPRCHSRVLLDAPGKAPHSTPVLPGSDALHRGPRGRLLLRLPQGNSSRNTHTKSS